MGAVTMSIPFDGRESLRGPLLASVIFHGLLVVVAIVYAIWGSRMGKGWGTSLNSGSSIHVNAVASLPGVPLPSPHLVTPSKVAVKSPGLYKTKPIPKPKPSPEAKKIPKFKDAVKPKHEKIRVNTRIQKKPIPAPPNAVPFGEGGKPMMNYSTVTTAAGEAGVAVNNGNFGQRFGWYVQAVRNRISNNWLLSTVSPSILTAPRVYVEFDIERNGAIANAHITKSSGIPEVDRSALRAVLASSPLAQLPADYSGSQVSVEFYFDYKR